MKFSELAQYLQRLEGTSKRLEITDILASLIEKLNENEIDKALYLSLGYLRAKYENEKFNIAEKMMARAIAKAFPSDQKVGTLYKLLGDLGDTAFKLNTNKQESDLEIIEVHQKLLDIAKTKGSGSQDNKINLLAKLLSQTSKISSKYIVRIVLGTTRLGFTELTIADALSKYAAGDKSCKKVIEAKYFIHPDIGHIAKIVKTKGMRGLEKIKLETGIPVLAQKAQRIGGLEKALEKIKTCWAEFKFDGTRVQLHFDKNKSFEVETKQAELFSSAKKQGFLIKTYTRNLEDSTHQHPDIAKAVLKQIKADSIILDGEAIGIDKKTGEFLPFQQIMQRKRKHSIKEISEEIPLKYFVFDILYLNGIDLTSKPLYERHKLLQSVLLPGEVINIADHMETSNLDELTSFYTTAKQMNLEGLIIKNPHKSYEAGARSYSWIKYKRADEKLLDDSIDAVVLGYYAGRGVRSKFGIGGFLIGVYDNKNSRFVTVSKVGTGLSDEDWEYLKREADKNKVHESPLNVDIPSMYTPDVFISPKLIVEIGADEITVSKTHSAGYALRFPRLLYFRTDKNADQATTLKEINKLFSLQKRGKYEKGGAN